MPFLPQVPAACEKPMPLVGTVLVPPDSALLDRLEILGYKTAPGSSAFSEVLYRRATSLCEHRCSVADFRRRFSGWRLVGEALNVEGIDRPVSPIGHNGRSVVPEVGRLFLEIG